MAANRCCDDSLGVSTNDVFAKALRHFRKQAAMSQEELASAAGLDRTYVSLLERARKSVTLTTLDKLAGCLGITPHVLLREPALDSPRVPADYTVRRQSHVHVARPSTLAGPSSVAIETRLLMNAVNDAHALIDDMYGAELDIATILGLRNLSAFVGELFAAALAKASGGKLVLNPHQDGYPDLLLMDAEGRKNWLLVEGRRKEKAPFSPFPSGGIEVKATCGSVPSLLECERRGIERPAIGDPRIDCLRGCNWKAHHRETNNLVGVLWDFIGGRPRVAALFYASNLVEEDWGAIVQPKSGGGRTTSVSIMAGSGRRKMYKGWLCVLSTGGYREFLNSRNQGAVIG